MHGLSHTLGMTVPTKLCFLLTFITPLAEGVSDHINSPGIPHLFSQLISDGEHLFPDIHMYVTYFAFADYYILSVYLLLDAQKISHSGKTFNKAQLSLDVHYPLAESISNHVNSPGSSLVVNIFISPMLFMPVTSFYLSVFCRMH